MSREHDLSPLSEAQLEVMNLVWERGEVTVSDVWKALRARRPLARTTVLTVMDRLEKKGWLERRIEGHLHFYSAVPSRRSTLRQLVDRLVETAFAGSAEELVVALLDGRDVSDDEARRIREIIEEARRKRS